MKAHVDVTWMGSTWSVSVVVPAGASDDATLEHAAKRRVADDLGCSEIPATMGAIVTSRF